MNINTKIFCLYIFLLYVIYTRGQLYYKIPYGEVSNVIIDFVDKNYLNNCYQDTGTSEIKLKCMNKNILDIFSRSQYYSNK